MAAIASEFVTTCSTKQNNGRNRLGIRDDMLNKTKQMAAIASGWFAPRAGIASGKQAIRQPAQGRQGERHVFIYRRKGSESTRKRQCLCQKIGCVVDRLCGAVAAVTVVQRELYQRDGHADRQSRHRRLSLWCGGGGGGGGGGVVGGGLHHGSARGKPT